MSGHRGPGQWAGSVARARTAFVPGRGALDVAAAIVMPVAVGVAALDGYPAVRQDVADHGGRVIPQREGGAHHGHSAMSHGSPHH